jgi:hypothetical protein
LLVGDLRYGTELQEWIDEYLGNLPKDNNEKVDFLTQEAKTDKKLRRILVAFSTDLEALLKKKAPPELEQVWAMERKRAPGRAPRARDTFVRRGLSKLLVFEDTELALKIFSGKRLAFDAIPEYAFELGFCSKAVGRAAPNDDEITNVVSLLGIDGVRAALRDAPLESMGLWIQPLRATSDLRRIHEWVCANFADLQKPKRLLHYLQIVADDPEGLLSQPISLRNNWLYYYLCDIIKADAELGQGFGYAQLLQLLRRNRVDLEAFLHSLKLPMFSMESQSFLDRGLRDWANRLETDQAKSFSPSFQAATAWALAHLAQSLSVASLPSFDLVRTKLVQTNLEQKLVTYRMFQPLRQLIAATAPSGSEVKIKACFGEKGGVSALSTVTTVWHVQQTIINWQSASDAGRDHKKKELCGRAVALRYSWDAKHERFIPRAGVQKLIMVVDGTWRREDLLALARAGWDEIFYPDEMDKLAAAIV